MPDATCGHCRKTIRLEAAAGALARCPYCKRRLTVAPAPLETGVTAVGPAAIRTMPPPQWTAAPPLDDLAPPPIRRRRGANDVRIAAAALLLVGLVGGFLGLLPRLWHPTVGPTPPRQLASPVVVAPPTATPSEAPEPPALPAPAVRPKPPSAPGPLDPDPRKARFLAKLQSLEWLFGPAQNLRYSADGRRASFLSHQGVRLWDVDEPKELLCLYSGPAEVMFAPDGGRALAFDHSGTMYLWDLETGEEVRRIHGPVSRFVFLSLSPDGDRALAGYAGPAHRTAIRMWDLNHGNEVTDPAAWDAVWVTQAAAVAADPIWPPCAGEAGPPSFTLQALPALSRPVEAEDGEPVGPPRYLLTLTAAGETTTESVAVDGGR